tara:strand:- start:100 stop:357 length:258 start_codon:yes stop_codon:yes gene_type:complete
MMKLFKEVTMRVTDVHPVEGILRRILELPFRAKLAEGLSDEEAQKLADLFLHIEWYYLRLENIKPSCIRVPVDYNRRGALVACDE